MISGIYFTNKNILFLKTKNIMTNLDTDLQIKNYWLYMLYFCCNHNIVVFWGSSPLDSLSAS